MATKRHPSENELVSRDMLPSRNATEQARTIRQAGKTKGPTQRYTAPKGTRAKAVNAAVKRGAIRP